MLPLTSISERCITTVRISALAEKHYRQAIEADPRYALAYFDLGNVLDETGRVHEAVPTYKTALQLAPTYADAHYNLALAFEKLREPRKALKHWQAYTRLDTVRPLVSARSQPDQAHPSGRWAKARLQAQQLTLSGTANALCHSEARRGNRFAHARALMLSAGRFPPRSD